MLLYIYIATVIIAILSIAGALYGISKEMKLNFTKEEIEEIKSFKKMKGSTSNPFTYVVIIFCPVINIIFSLVYVFGYNSVRDKVIDGYIQKINE